MLGYALFIVPMCIAFVWVSAKQGIRQALLDLIAFNLLFAFDFAALLPGNLQLYAVHLLGAVFAGYELLHLLRTGRARLPRRTVLVLAAILVFAAWLGAASYLNRDWEWTRILNYVMTAYILSILYVIVGIRLAKTDKLVRFGKILVFAGACVGLISLVQTASNGALFPIDWGDNYLGVFQPLGAKYMTRRDLAESTIRMIELVRTIHFGNLTFFRATGTFEGAYAILCAIAILTFSLLTSRRRQSPWLFIPFASSLAGVIVAFNRTAAIAFALSTAGVLLVRPRTLVSHRVIRRWLLPVALALPTALVLAQPISNVIAANLDGFFGNRATDQVGTLTGRTVLWSYVLPEIARNPIIGTSQPVTLARSGLGKDDNPNVDLGTHSGFLEYAYRGGLVPAVIFVLLLCFCLLRSLGLARDRRLLPSERDQFLALAAATGGFAVTNLTVALMGVPQVSALFWLICGFLATYKPRPAETQGAPV